MSFSAETAGLLVLIGFGVGAFGTLMGAGGGFILTPILLLLYPHDSAQTLTAISLATVFFNAASGSAAYARQRRIDFRSGSVFALATLPGAIGGAIVVGSVSRQLFDGLMGAMLALLALWLIAGERWPLPQPRRHLEQRALVDHAGEVCPPHARTLGRRRHGGATRGSYVVAVARPGDPVAPRRSTPRARGPPAHAV